MPCFAELETEADAILLVTDWKPYNYCL